MSNTDVLRHLLDKRCIKWTKPSKDGERWTSWHGIDGTLFSATEDARDCVWIGGSVTPIQAITMTLGRGKCKRFWTGSEMICSECAHQLNDQTANFCQNCGREVEQ